MLGWLHKVAGAAWTRTAMLVVTRLVCGLLAAGLLGFLVVASISDPLVLEGWFALVLLWIIIGISARVNVWRRHAGE